MIYHGVWHSSSCLNFLVWEIGMKKLSWFLSTAGSKYVDSEEDRCLLSPSLPSEPRKFPNCIAFNGFHLKKKLRNGALAIIPREAHESTATGNNESTEVNVLPNGAEETHGITTAQKNESTKVDRFPEGAPNPRTRSVKRSSSWRPDPNRRWPIQGW